MSIFSGQTSPQSPHWLHVEINLVAIVPLPSRVPGKMVAGMGGAMDLVAGARRVVVAMQHAAKGAAKIVPELTLPPTSSRPVSLVVTDLAVIEPTPDGLVLRERAPGVTVGDILAVTTAPLILPDSIPEMTL